MFPTLPTSAAGDRPRLLADPDPRRRARRRVLRRPQPRDHAAASRSSSTPGAPSSVTPGQLRSPRSSTPPTSAGCSSRTTTTTTSATCRTCSSTAQATLVCSFSIVSRLAGDVELPLDRMRWVDPGGSFDAGDRTLHAVRPPMFDSPATRGLFDPSTGLLWAADSFGTFFPGEVYDADDIPADLYDATFDLLNGWNTPWLEWVDPDRYRCPRHRHRRPAAGRRRQRPRPGPPWRPASPMPSGAPSPSPAGPSPRRRARTSSSTCCPPSSRRPERITPWEP